MFFLQIYRLIRAPFQIGSMSDVLAAASEADQEAFEDVPDVFDSPIAAPTILSQFYKVQI